MGRTSVFLAVSIGLALSACHQGPGELPYPSSQRQFVDLNRGCMAAYRAGTNEIQRSLAFNSCNESRSQFAAHSPIRGWLGTVESISTDQGADVVSFRIATSMEGFDITYGTVSNRMSDARYGSLITQTSPLFGVLANLHEGDWVMFNGEFLGDPAGKMGTWESSMTERGSMEEPEFNIRFTDVEPFNDDPTNRAPYVSAPVGSGVSRMTMPRSPSPETAASPKHGADSAPSSSTTGDEPYAKRRAQLLEDGYAPSRKTAGTFPLEVAGDPAVCGNAGCQIPWFKGNQSICVSVQVNDNLDESDWLSQQSAGPCD